MQVQRKGVPRVFILKNVKADTLRPTEWIEIYKLVNKKDVEFIHFYNPGEATAIFSSVKIATKVINYFNKQKTRADSPYFGVHVAFARDFNEAKPEKLWTAYDKDGHVECDCCNGFECYFD